MKALTQVEITEEAMERRNTEQDALVESRMMPAPTPPTRTPVTFDELKAAIEAHEQLILEITELEQMKDDVTKAINDLSTSCFLEDQEALAKIGRLHVLAGILPQRLESRENGLVEHSRSLAETAGDFLSRTLAPKVRALRARACDEVRKELSAHLKEEWMLTRAIESSESVLAVDRIYCTLDVNPNNAREYALRLVKSWNQVTAIDKNRTDSDSKKGR